MAAWSLEELLAGLHDQIEQQLRTSRAALGHPGTKGDASEGVWLALLNKYLPERYRVAKAHVVDSEGAMSDQIDVLVFDRQYTPFIFTMDGATIVPAESVYAAFEAKQALNSTHVEYAKEKVLSVRALHRTSLPIPHAGGTYPAKSLIPILGGVLTFASDWSPALGESLIDALSESDQKRSLDMGCVAADGYFFRDATGDMRIVDQGKPATAFLFKLIEKLQFSGTVPMIDMQAYANWLHV